MDSITQEIRKLLLAGLGAAAESKERGEKILDELAEKGEATLKHGKIVNEELKRSIHNTLHSDTKADDLMNAVKDMDAEQLEALKAQIAKAEEARSESAEAQETADGSEG